MISPKKKKSMWAVYRDPKTGKLDAIDQMVDEIPEGLVIIGNITCDKKVDALDYVRVMEEFYER